MADNNNGSKMLVWIIAVLAATGLLLWVASLVFPQLISKLTGLLVGLLMVVTGLFFRRKK